MLVAIRWQKLIRSYRGQHCKIKQSSKSCSTTKLRGVIKSHFKPKCLLLKYSTQEILIDAGCSLLSIVRHICSVRPRERPRDIGLVTSLLGSPPRFNISHQSPGSRILYIRINFEELEHFLRSHWSTKPTLKPVFHEAKFFARTEKEAT